MVKEKDHRERDTCFLFRGRLDSNNKGKNLSFKLVIRPRGKCAIVLDSSPEKQNIRA